MTIGDRIKQRRKELEMSQEELAHKLGYKSRSSVNKIELGGQNLTQKKIKKIADALDTTPELPENWKDVYASLTPENKQVFWKRIIKSIIITSENKEAPEIILRT